MWYNTRIGEGARKRLQSTINEYQTTSRALSSWFAIESNGHLTASSTDHARPPSSLRSLRPQPTPILATLGTLLRSPASPSLQSEVG